ncbi:DUF1273 family protein [Oscillospiraceae bacterium CM]|nr:DUF1273 family protein [Oscillospiraceae bacterium CM]
MDEKTCCVTGHREIAVEKIDYVKQALHHEILQAIADGYTHFISGFYEGVDLLFASIVADLMEDNPALTLEAALPYRNRMKTTDKLFRRLLLKCKTICIHSEKYSPSCYMKCSREMVSLCQRVIAVYDGRDKGNTVFAMREAAMLERDIRVIEI